MPDELWDTPELLPKTIRGQLPYSVEALSPREVWGHGHASTMLICKQQWNYASDWIRYMLGEWVVEVGFSGDPVFRRLIPEKLRYGELDPTADPRIQWCTGVSQTEQGGNPVEAGSHPDDSEERFAQSGTNWPAAAWAKYQTTFETTPYVIRTDAEIQDLQNFFSGPDLEEPTEFLRYVIRSKRAYNREQPIPAATNEGGFRLVETPLPPYANRKPIGQVAFKTIGLADVSYKWCGVPLGWPPPPGWVPPGGNLTWPPPNNPAISSDATTITARTRDSYIGRINSRAFDYNDPEGYCFAAGTLLYTGYEEQQYYNASGQRTCDITFRFKFKEGGWNYVMDSLGVWRYVTADVVRMDQLAGSPDGRPLFESKDFRKLFDYTTTA